MELRNILLRVLVMVLFLTALLFTIRFCTRSVTDLRRSLEGDGNLIRYEHVPEHPFSHLKVQGNTEVFIRQSDMALITIEADSNLIPHLQLGHDDETLVFGRPHRLKMARPVRLLVSVPDLDKITIEGAANLDITDTFRTDGLWVEIHGAGMADLTLSVHHFKGSISGAGEIKLAGEALVASNTINGAGKVAATNFITADQEVEVNGAGSAHVSVTDRLKATINGTGLIEYHGDPTVTPKINGIGQIRPARR